jgi:hypothetical protein
MLVPNEVPQFRERLQPQASLEANGKNLEVEAMERAVKARGVR